MSLEKYRNGIKQLIKALDPIAQHYRKPKLFFFADALGAIIKYGVTPNQYIGFRFYEKSSWERSEFYTRRYYLKTEKKLNDPKYYDIFWNKCKFNDAFAKFIHRDWLYCATASEEEIRRFLDEHAKVMVKPTSASSGKGIHIYKNEAIKDLIDSKALLEEYVNQHHEVAALNPSSVNTVRIYTILDKNKELHILSASIRVGGSGSEVDNFHAGGVGYPLDTDSGVVVSTGRSIMGIDYIFHPSTGVKVVGFEVPNWKELIEFVTSATQVFPTARMIAWDVAILENGFEMIEGNYNGDPGFMQAPSGRGKKHEIEKYM